MTRPVDVVLARLDRHKAKGHGQWIARCPAHDDRNPSLSIKEGENGAVLLKCFAGCDIAAVVAAMGLELSDLFPPRDSASRGSSVVQRNFTRPGGARPEREQPTANSDAPKPRLFTLTRVDQIQLKPTDWLIDGYLVRDTLAGLIAPPGACKSFLAIDWACRVATGTDWNGREVKQGAVFYLAGEGQSGIRKRTKGWEAHFGVSLTGAPMFVSSSMPFLVDPTLADLTADHLEEAAEAVFFECGAQPELIVIDTLARAMNGANENDTADMGAFVRACDTLRQRWNCTVLIVHHTGHDPGAQWRGRGSSNFGASLDSDFYLKADGNAVELRAGTKAKDWPTPPPAVLTRVVVPLEVPAEDGEIAAESTLVLINSAAAIMERGKRDQAMELRQQGLSERDIAKRIGVGKSTVHRWLKEAA